MIGIGIAISNEKNNTFSFNISENPDGLNATTVSNTRINLTWNDNSSNETGYSIERSTNGTSYTEIGTVLAGVTAYSDMTCSAGTLYYYRVRAFKGTIYSGYSNVDSDTTIANQNLMKYSEQIDNGVYTSSHVTVTPNQAVDMEGNTTLDMLTTDAVGHSIYYRDGGTFVVVVPGSTYRFSFDVIRGTMTELKYSVYNWSTPGNITAATSYYSQTSATVSRVSFTFIAPAGCTAAAVYFIRDSGVTGTVYVGRAQVETNGSSYVKTTTTIITP
jgi:hypothetical protein